MMTHQAPDFSKLLESWGSPFVAREKIGEFSGGMIRRRYLANLDSRGEGPPGRFRVGRKVAYPVSEVVKWLEGRVS